MARTITISDKPQPGVVQTLDRTGIFICYRREDSRWPAGRLADALRERFGHDNVFIDVDRVRVGNWRQQINQALDSSAAVVVLIGPSWVAELERLRDEPDEVRYEIAAAIERGKLILPVTLGSVTVPSRRALPQDIASLLDQEVYQLGEDRMWRPTVDVLIGDLAAALRPGEPSIKRTRIMRRPPGTVEPKPPSPKHARVDVWAPAGYEITSLMRSEKFGDVYLARQTLLDREVSLQILSGPQAANPLARRRFLRQHAVVAAISHPNLIPIYEAAEEDGRAFVAMRSIDGQTLRSLRIEAGRLDPATVSALLSQVADALAAAHLAGVVHGDINLINVLVSDEGGAQRAYLTGFSPPPTVEESKRYLTQAGAELATPAYLAPEMIRGNPGDPRSDIYSLGCVVFHLLTGRLPFERNTPLAMLMAHLNDEPPSLHEFAPDAPHAYAELVRVATSKAAEQRQQTAAEFAAALRAAAEAPN